MAHWYLQLREEVLPSDDTTDAIFSRHNDQVPQAQRAKQLKDAGNWCLQVNAVRRGVHEKAHIDGVVAQGFVLADFQVLVGGMD